MDPKSNLADVGNSQSYKGTPASFPRPKTSIRFSLAAAGSSSTRTDAQTLEDRANVIFGTSLPKVSFRSKHVESNVDPPRFRQILGNDEQPYPRFSSQDFFKCDTPKSVAVADTKRFKKFQICKVPSFWSNIFLHTAEVCSLAGSAELAIEDIRHTPRSSTAVDSPPNTEVSDELEAPRERRPSTESLKSSASNLFAKNLGKMCCWCCRSKPKEEAHMESFTISK